MEKICKHCGKKLSKIAIPENSDWNTEFLFVCMNDDCQYYIRGWEWMKTNFNSISSYRYMINPLTNIDGPIPVFTNTQYKNLIINYYEL